MTRPLPVNSINIAVGFQHCSGKSPIFVRDELRQSLFHLPKDRKTYILFYSAKLRNVLLSETQSFLDRAIYQLCVYKHLVSEKKFSWAAVTAYYSSFYALCSLIRLQGKSLSWIDQELYLIFSNNLLKDEYYIRKARSQSSHQELWSTFYALYGGFDLDRSEYGDLYTGYGDPKEEITIRNHLTYRLGSGFGEFYWSPDACNRHAKKLGTDVFADRQGSLKDDDLRLEIRAALRIKLVLRVLGLIAESSPYDTYHKAYAERRKTFIARSLKSKPLENRLLSWVAGSC